jgi:signal recognition particle subunit SEC65
VRWFNCSRAVRSRFRKVPAAAFESEPQASAAATTLRELGFTAEVYVHGANDFEERTRSFFSGNPAPFEAKALLVSNDADEERFLRTVQRHYGVLR